MLFGCCRLGTVIKCWTSAGVNSSSRKHVCILGAVPVIHSRYFSMNDGSLKEDSLVDAGISAMVFGLIFKRQDLELFKSVGWVERP